MADPLNALKPLLRTGRFVELLQAIELLAALDDAEVSEAALSWMERGLRRRDAPWPWAKAALLGACRGQSARLRERAEALEQVAVTQPTEAALRALESLPRLRALTVVLGPETPPGLLARAMGRLPRLSELRLRDDGAPRPFEGLEALEQLTVLRLSGPRASAALPRLPALRELRLHHVPFDRLAPFVERAPRLRRLQIGSMDALRTLEELRGWPELESVAFVGRLGLHSLRGLPPATLTTSAGSLHLGGWPHLADLEGLGAVEGLRRLSLMHCPRLKSLAGLEDCPELDVLDVRGCKELRDVEALEACPAIRVVATGGAPLATESLPPRHRWAHVQADMPDFDALARREPPEAPPKKSWRRDRFVEEVRGEIALGDVGRVAAAVRRLRARGDAASYDALLERFRWRRGKDGLQRSTSPGYRRHWKRVVRQLAFLQLVADAPARSRMGAKLRPQLVDLYLQGEIDRAHGIRIALPLAPLAAFPNLRSVTFHAADGLRAAPSWAPASLREVRVLGLRERLPLGFLAEAPLVSLTLAGVRPVRWDVLAACATLRTLELSARIDPPTAEVLATLPALEEVRWRGDAPAGFEAAMARLRPE
ncbi:MAG TPA: hypothetical protein RMG45_27910, partial [Polyangiaceae bacterium LLY-WYZ-15_(1-7)]|nr:hypothetical protein [Polyangiaceae bacterium LLY-WYZ-15_(1-7)]